MGVVGAQVQNRGRWYKEVHGSSFLGLPDDSKNVITQANMAEHVGSSSKSNSKAKGKGKKKNDKKGKGKVEYLAPKAGIVKQKFQGSCYNCSNNSGWWVDTGATRHVCAEKSMFHSFRAVDKREKLYMGTLNLLISRAKEMLFCK
nr:hypothetical protein [Tanacetum cinerariifolium]